MASNEPSTVMNTALSFGLADLPRDLQLEEFTQFPGLPIELRLKIWTLSLPGPRIVELFYEEWEWETGEPGEELITLLRCRSTYQVPTALHVCLESRQEALKHYTLTFGCYFRSTIYFNFATDTLSINCCGLNGTGALMEYFLDYAIGLDKVRKIAIGAAIDEHLERCLLGSPVPIWKSLETLIMTDSGDKIEDWESVQIDLHAGDSHGLLQDDEELLEQWKKGGPKREVFFGKFIEGGKDCVIPYQC